MCRFAARVVWHPFTLESLLLLATLCPLREPATASCLACALQGMVKAYRTLLHMLERQYGATESGSSTDSSNPGATAAAPSGKASQVALGADGSAAGARVAAAAQEREGANIAALLANPQTNAAAFLVIVMVMVLIWRLAFMQPALLQAMRGVASAVAQR